MLESEDLFILAVKRLRDDSHLLLNTLLLLKRGSLENDTKLDLSMLSQKLELYVLDQLLKVSRESFKDLVINGHASSALSEITANDFLVAILKDVELHLHTNLVKEDAVTDIDPLDHVIQVLHRLTIELEEVQFVEQGVQVLQEWRQLSFQGFLVEIDQGFSYGVIQEVQFVGAVHGAVTCE